MIIILKIIIISIFTGVLSGLFSTLFLNSLFYVTNLRNSYSFLIFLLPIFGLLTAYISKVLPRSIDASVSSIKNSFGRDERLLSFATAPYIFITSIGTHLFGGSAGREGVGVLMGASLSTGFQKVFSLDEIKIRNIILKCGMAAGFSSIFGAPIAAIAFAYEIDTFKDCKNKTLFVATTFASISAYYVTLLLGLEHKLPQSSYRLDSQIVYYVIISGLICGLGALAYYQCLKTYQKYIVLTFKNIYLRFFTGSLLISATIFCLDAYQYSGIGASFINESFITQRTFYDFFIKFILTVFTLGLGFKGGEVTPLFFMGSSLSNAVLAKLGFVNFGVSSALGMFALFGAATATPITSILMAFDLFGYELALIALPTCLIARLLMFKKSLY